MKNWNTEVQKHLDAVDGLSNTKYVYRGTV